MLEHPAHSGVTGLVEGNGPLLLLGDQLVLLLESADHTVHGVQEVLLAHLLGVATGSDERRLVADVGDVRSTEAGRLAGQEVHINRVVRLEGAQVHIEDGLPLLEVRHVHVNLAVETAGPHEGAVQDVRPVGGSEDDDPAVSAEAIHLGEELVERVLAFVVGSNARILAPRAAHGVDLVDEHDARALLLGLLEQVADPAGADPHEHLHKIRTAEREERHLGLPRHRLGEQGLSRARRADEQSALGNLGPEVRVLAGILQEFHDFTELLLGAIQSGHILEVDLGRILLVEELGLGFAHVEDLAAAGPAAAETAHEDHPHAHHQGEDDDVEDELLTPLIGAFIGHGHDPVRSELIQPVNVLFGRRNLHHEVGPLQEPSPHWPVLPVLHDGVSGSIGVPRLNHHPVVAQLAELAGFRLAHQLLETDAPCGRVRPTQDHGDKQSADASVDPVEVEVGAARLSGFRRFRFHGGFNHFRASGFSQRD